MIKPARPKLRNKNRGIWTKLLGSKTNNEKNTSIYSLSFKGKVN
jgi:hypothetical protein